MFNYLIRNHASTVRDADKKGVFEDDKDLILNNSKANADYKLYAQSPAAACASLCNNVVGILPAYLSGKFDAYAEFYLGVENVSLGAIAENFYLTLNRDPVVQKGLKYYDNKTKRWTTGPSAKQLSYGTMLYCAEVGKLRFDTKLVRNLVWMAQLQRIMRVVMINHLSWLDTPVIRGLRITNHKVTEYDGNDTFTADDFNGVDFSYM